MPETTVQQNSTDTVRDAVRELHELGQIAARETVAHRTGLKLSIVDDRLRALTDDGDLVRVARGVYEPVTRYDEPRAMSKTVLPDGHVKYDIGNEVLTLTPAEARRLAELSMGAAATAVAIQSAHGQLGMTMELAKQMKQQKLLIDDMRETIKKLRHGAGAVQMEMNLPKRKAASKGKDD